MSDDRATIESGNLNISNFESEKESIHSEYSTNQDDNISVRSVDSGYESDSNLADKKDDIIRVKTKNEIENINKLIGRAYTYKLKFLKKLTPQLSKELIANELLIDTNESFMSAITGLAVENFYRNLSDQKTEELLDNFSLNIERSKGLMNDNDKAKTDRQFANLEASLKGFVLNDIKSSNNDENKIALEAVKKVILELKGQAIPKSDYASTVINNTMESLQADPRAFSTEQLNIFNETINQGNKTVKFSKDFKELNKTELTALSNAVNESANSFIKELAASRNNGLSPELVNYRANESKRLLLTLSTKIQDTDTGSMEEQKSRQEAFCKQLLPYVHMPSELATKLFEEWTPTELHSLIGKEAQKFFSVDNAPKNSSFLTLDKTKITEENIKRFADSINPIIKAEDAKLISQPILEESINKIQNKTDIKITEQQNNKISEQLSPTLIELGSEQLRNHKEGIISDITNKIAADKSWYSSVIKKLPISTNNLQDIATYLTDKYSNQTTPTMSTSVSTPPPPLTQHSSIETKQIPEPSSSDFVVSTPTEAQLENRSLSKFAYAEEFKEATEPRPATYSDVREEQSTGSTNKLPAEVEFRKRSNIEAHRLNETTDQLDNRVLVDKLQSNLIAQMDKPKPQELVEDTVRMPNPKVEEVHDRQDTINTSMIAIKSEQEMPTKAPIVQETQTDKLSSMKPQNNPSMSRITSTIKTEIQQVKKTLRHIETIKKELETPTKPTLKAVNKGRLW
ncbi:palindromic element RPE1 domain-containing protein [Candidatus Tisiphia endosymbiont of Nedyus quadrimaculatus]|uniref:palindromic element RPE1 domain-containing protein n=1 Tax=Candidatus Tisiphia endosymbiont of Nedyus quadrimaculatus TaxID=3139332 RepID=UPI00345F0E44